MAKDKDPDELIQDSTITIIDKGIQPRASSTDTLAVQLYYKASMQAELQKFGREDKVRQLLLGEDIDSNSVEVSGLDLAETEDRALSAVQILLDQTDYKGNIPGDHIQSDSWKFDGYIPRLSVTYSEYFEAYGLPQRGGQYYAGKQAQEALEGLYSLAETRTIIYERKKYIGKGKSKKLKLDLIKVTKPLITISEGYKDLDQEEADQVKAGQSLPQKRNTRLLIEISPLLVDQIDTFYLLKPTTLHSEIKTLYPGKRISRVNSLFIEWLLTKNTKQVRIQKRRLAKILRLDYLIKQRRASILDSRIQEALQTALELEYLLDYKEDATGLLIFKLNPEKCKKSKQEEG